MNRNSHIIQKHAVEVEFQNISANPELKDQLGEVCKSRLLPAIEKLFNDYGDQHLTFEKLEVDAGAIAYNNWQNEFVDNVISELRDRLHMRKFSQSGNQILQNHENKINNQNQINNGQLNEAQIQNREVHGAEIREAEIVLHFIKTGLLPWFAGELKPYDLKHSLDVILNSANKFFIINLKEILIENASALIRFVYQFTEEQLTKVLLQLSFQSAGFQLIQVWKLLLTWLNITQYEQIKIIYSSAFSNVAEADTEAFTKSFCENIFSGLTETQSKILLSRLSDKALVAELENSFKPTGDKANFELS